MGQQSKSMDVLVMVSAIDSLGAVTNSTKKIRVELKHPSSLDLQVTHYEQFYQSSVQSQANQRRRIRDLILLSTELTQLYSSGVYPESDIGSS